MSSGGVDGADDRPSITVSNDDDASSARAAAAPPPEGEIPDSDSLSDTDAHHRLEVVFEDDTTHRRRSSLSTIPSRPAYSTRKESCFVHGFLQHDQLNGDGATPRGEGAAAQDKGRHPPQDKTSSSSGGNDGGGGEGEVDHGDLRSRLLTKKQLSDMAFSIRELSKRLGRFRLTLDVKNVFVLTKAHDRSLIKHTRAVTEWLMSPEAGGPYTVFVEDTLKHAPEFGAEEIVAKCGESRSRLKYWTTELCRSKPSAFDIVLALGGDGTVLYASWLFQRVVPPVLSFALGSLGFLTKFDFDDHRAILDQAFHHGITVSLRLRLEATVMRAQGALEGADGRYRDLIDELIGDESAGHHTHQPDGSYDILNDVVMDRGSNATMSSIEVFGDNHHLTTIQADGVCIATPTGSTAYNLAAGGSLCHPDNPVILLTAICAHTLSFRPILLPDTVLLRVGVPYDARTSPWVSFDGKERIEMRAGDYVTVSASRFPFPTVLPLGKGGEDWVESLSRTLNWNNRSRQKAFKDK